MCSTILYFKNVKMQFQPSRPQLTSTIPVAKVRESPDISKTNAVADAGEQKLILAAPLPSGKVGRWLMDRRGRAGCKLGLWNRTAHTMRHREPIHLGLTLSRRENRNQSHLCIGFLNTSLRLHVSSLISSKQMLLLFYYLEGWHWNILCVSMNSILQICVLW